MRLQVHVARVGVDGAHEDRPHEAHHRGLVFLNDDVGGDFLADHLLGRFEIGHFHVDDGLAGDDAVVEAAVERRVDATGQRDERLDAVAGDQLRLADGVHVVGRQHRKLQAAAMDADGHHTSSAGQFLGDESHDLRIDPLGDDLDVGHAVLLGERLAELIGGDQPAAKQDDAEQPLLGALRREAHFEAGRR